MTDLLTVQVHEDSKSYHRGRVDFIGFEMHRPPVFRQQRFNDLFNDIPSSMGTVLLTFSLLLHHESLNHYCH